MCIIVMCDYHYIGGGAYKLDRYPFGKMKKSQEQYQWKNKILPNFRFFFLWWISKILNMGGPWCCNRRAGGVIRSENWENNKNSTHTKIKFYIIFILIFLLRWILKILQIGVGARGQAGGWWNLFFYIFLYYFTNVIIKPLYISSFCFCLRYI